MSIPALTDAQRELARTAATQARRRRAEIKNGLRDGSLSLAEALDLAERDDIVAHTKVVDALKSLPRVGEVRARRVMAELQIAPNRRLRGLGKHQVAGLISEFS
ncbi:hypothetical protein FHX74_002716 [Friedmanniella endophytica]|uniref:Integration host factor-like helix-two turn-helix domain-containing protein n=1 Tax=Microlunatus kandeliicorticis TaxID=1759536 RepID=A0A7W3P6K7_9ACTN|nr:integration host factor, actinobacterial type [Microlunatus kandeliicorticis]MBA8795088.1 hypothetical protein [Microlunatus kandeliicorticis]